MCSAENLLGHLHSSQMGTTNQRLFGTGTMSTSGHNPHKFPKFPKFPNFPKFPRYIHS